MAYLCKKEKGAENAMAKIRIGLQVIRAAKLAAEGRSAKSIARELENARDNVQATNL